MLNCFRCSSGYDLQQAEAPNISFGANLEAVPVVGHLYSTGLDITRLVSVLYRIVLYLVCRMHIAPDRKFNCTESLHLDYVDFLK
jgi:hypothetical protein